MTKRLAFSSDVYLLNVDDVLSLNNAAEYEDKGKIVILFGEAIKGQQDTLLSGRKICQQAKDEGKTFVEVKVAYYSIAFVKALFVQLIKAFKRKSHIISKNIYRTTLANIIANDLPRGIRTKENAYGWGENWGMSKEDGQKRYEELYNSIKTSGYDIKHPMYVALNRKMGVKDQILQGHHRIGICQELGVDDVSISFWAFPKTFNCKGAQ